MKLLQKEKFVKQKKTSAHSYKKKMYEYIKTVMLLMFP